MFSIGCEPCELCELLNRRLTRFTRLTGGIYNAQIFAILVAPTFITDLIEFVGLIPIKVVIRL